MDETGGAETEPSESETEPSESETEPSESETEPSEPDSEADEADKADGEEPEKAGVSLDELEIKHTISSDHFADDGIPEPGNAVHKEVEKSVSSSTSTKEQFTGEAALNKLKEMGLEDLYNAAPEASEEDASDGEQDHTEIKEQVQEQIQTLTDSEDLDTVMAEEVADELAEVIAEEISESVEQVIGIEVWKTDDVVESDRLMSSKDTNTNQLLQMSEESEKHIKEAGYTENSLKTRTCL